MLVMSLPMILFLATLILAFAVEPSTVIHAFTAHGGLPIVAMYLLSFGMAPFYGFVYWLKDNDTRLWRALFYAHLFTLYGYMWFPAGWMATWKVLRRQRGWAKTDRTADDMPAGATDEIVSPDEEESAA